MLFIISKHVTDLNEAHELSQGKCQSIFCRFPHCVEQLLNQCGDNGGDNTLSVLNGWANVGGLWCGNSGKNFVNIRDGHLDVGYFTSAKVTVTMLAGGKGEFKLADLRCGTSNSGCNFKNKASPRCPIAFCSWKANIPLCYKIDRLIEITLCATFNTIKSFRASYFPTSVALLFFSFWPPNEGLLNV